MYSLIITAHPSSHGFTHAIAQKYCETKEKNGHTVEILDLYKTELQMDFLRYEEKIDMKTIDPVVSAIQKKITEAEELVFIFPIWWVNVPAILKNFFDRVLSSGFAFQYVEGKNMPKKLLTTKVAKIFCTCDAPKVLYWMIGNPLRMILQLGTLGYCGIKINGYFVFDQMRKRSPEECQKLLKTVEKIAQ